MPTERELRNDIEQLQQALDARRLTLRQMRSDKSTDECHVQESYGPTNPADHKASRPPARHMLGMIVGDLRVKIHQLEALSRSLPQELSKEADEALAILLQQHKFL